MLRPGPPPGAVWRWAKFTVQEQTAVYAPPQEVQRVSAALLWVEPEDRRAWGVHAHASEFDRAYHSPYPGQRSSCLNGNDAPKLHDRTQNGAHKDCASQFPYQDDTFPYPASFEEDSGTYRHCFYGRTSRVDRDGHGRGRTVTTDLVPILGRLAVPARQCNHARAGGSDGVAGGSFRHALHGL